MRAELIGHFKACMTEIYLHIDARMADYIRTHPYGKFSSPLAATPKSRAGLSAFGVVVLLQGPASFQT